MDSIAKNILDSIFGTSRNCSTVALSGSNTSNAEIEEEVEISSRVLSEDKPEEEAISVQDVQKDNSSISFGRAEKNSRSLKKSQTSLLKCRQKASRPTTIQEKAQENPLTPSSAVSCSSKPRKLGTIPSYLNKSRESCKSLKDFQLLKKKFDAEKPKLFQCQVNFMKVYNDCKKACEKASQVFDESFKLVVLDDQNRQLFLGESETIDVGDLDLKEIVQSLVTDFKDNSSGDSIADVAKIENLLKDEIQKKLRDVMMFGNRRICAVSDSHKSLNENNESDEREGFSQTKDLQEIQEKIESLEADNKEKDLMMKEKMKVIEALELKLNEQTKNGLDFEVIMSLKAKNEPLAIEKAELDSINQKLSEENDELIKMVNELKLEILEKRGNALKNDITDTDKSSIELIRESLIHANEKIAQENLKLKENLAKEKANARDQDSLLAARSTAIIDLMETEVGLRGQIENLNQKIREMEEEIKREKLQTKANHEETANLFKTLAAKHFKIDYSDTKIEIFDNQKLWIDTVIEDLKKKAKETEEKYRDLQIYRDALKNLK